MNIDAKSVEVEVPHGTSRLAGSENGNRFVETEYQSKLLTEIVQTFAVGEVCLVGKIAVSFGTFFFSSSETCAFRNEFLFSVTLCHQSPRTEGMWKIGFDIRIGETIESNHRTNGTVSGHDR